MSATTCRSLVLADRVASAPPAVRWAPGDATIQIGRPTGEEAEAIQAQCFDAAVVSGDVADGTWLSGSFELAGACLVPGGRVTLVLAEPPAGDSAVPMHDLPASISSAWRLVGLAVEHPVTAVSFVRAADSDGAGETTVAFRHVQLVSALYRHPELVPALDVELARAFRMSPGPAAEEDPDAEVDRLRRDLAAYRNSVLGRLTTRSWTLRRALRRGASRVIARDRQTDHR